MMIRRAFPAIAAVLLVAAGCGGDDDGAAPAGGAGETIEVVATEFAFEPDSIEVDAPGEYTLRLVNRGDVAHALHVEGRGVSVETDEVPAGESAEARVTLERGTYALTCPVGNHAGLGMRGTLDVAQAGAGGEDPTERDPAYDY